MSNLAKLDFLALDITEKNYLSWVLDVEIHLNSNNLGDTIKEGNESTDQNKAKVMIFLRHHIHEDLKNEYLTIKDPLTLWNKLKESEYNSAMFRITSQLILCGENITDKEMLEKTFSTFHASNLLLQQQYREKGFKKYSELISCLLVAKQNNELLMKNHKTRPTGIAPFPEANVAIYNDQSGSRGRGHGRGRGCGYGHGRRNYHDETTPNACYRCGDKYHWARTCRTPKHLVELYQQSIKGKGKGIETNFTYEIDNVDISDGYNDLNDTTHMDVSDFLTDTPNPNVDGSSTPLDASNLPYI
ncbi:hypothetical protein QVD17_39244 [Tagetes erecta]|uniref:CCHC-type domain-containing protein n=1 Tax=Tagetes erecta TaxID=13708 RepID=A0AAD8JQD1_TARER|nr:hypothetical protein QVD17_39244 [Tagetes erecta]